MGETLAKGDTLRGAEGDLVAVNKRAPLHSVRAELEMDLQTKQLLEALEKRVALQLGPLASRVGEILDELRERGKRISALETDRILLRERQDRYEKDLTKGFSAIRESMDKRDKALKERLEDAEESLDRKLRMSNRWIAPIAGGVPVVVSILIALFIWWAKN